MSGSALAVNKFFEIPLNPPFFLSRDHFVGKGGVLFLLYLKYLIDHKFNNNNNLDISLCGVQKT
jgi:hypothetical protein